MYKQYQRAAKQVLCRHAEDLRLAKLLDHRRKNRRWRKIPISKEQKTACTYCGLCSCSSCGYARMYEVESTERHRNYLCRRDYRYLIVNNLPIQDDQRTCEELDRSVDYFLLLNKLLEASGEEEAMACVAKLEERQELKRIYK